MLIIDIVSPMLDIVLVVLIGHPPTIYMLAIVSIIEVPYVVVQMIWMKLILSTFSFKALVFQKKTKDVMQKAPTKCQPFINNEIHKNIIIHNSYEIVYLQNLAYIKRIMLEILIYMQVPWTKNKLNYIRYEPQLIKCKQGFNRIKISINLQ